MREEPYSEEVAEMVANIIGPHSAAAQALEELKKRRANGEEVYLWRAGSAVVVGPRRYECQP